MDEFEYYDTWGDGSKEKFTEQYVPLLSSMRLVFFYSIKNSCQHPILVNSQNLAFGTAVWKTVAF